MTVTAFAQVNKLGFPLNTPDGKMHQLLHFLRAPIPLPEERVAAPYYQKRLNNPVMRIGMNSTLRTDFCEEQCKVFEWSGPSRLLP